jgi:TPR repeat protein
MSVDSKIIAREMLKDAFSRLSGGAALPKSNAPAVSLKDWMSKPLESLDNEQLVELGKAMLTGVPGIPADKALAFAAFTEAANRGVKGAAYSRAMCLQGGVGVTKDSVKALEELEYLATNGEFGYAHVSKTLLFDTPKTSKKSFLFFIDSS